MDDANVTVDRDLVTEWIDALESGRYLQGTNYLRYGDAYCCLGVLCDVASPDGWTSPGYHTYLYNGEPKLLPRAVANRVGLSVHGEKPTREPWPFARATEHPEALTTQNDAGANFGEIAGALREHYGIPKGA